MSLKSVGLTCGLLSAAACGRSLEGTGCPCVAAYECCASDGLCHRPGTCTASTSTSTGGSGGSDETGNAGASAAGGDGALKSAPIPLPDFCSSDGWCGATVDYSSVFGTGADDIWLTAHHVSDNGSASALLHWDGSAWSTRHLSDLGFAAQNGDLHALVGRSATDVWALSVNDGALYRWDGSSWAAPPSGWGYASAIWTGPVSDVWAFGGNGAARWDGSAWQTLALGATFAWRGAWGSSDHDVWAVGDAGNIYHSDGGTLTRYADAFGSSPTSANLSAVWGRSSKDVWAVGAGATVLHWDGESWQEMGHDAPTRADLNAVWGDSASVWLATDDGSLVRREGDRWFTAPLAKVPLRGVWGADGAGVWAVGDHGTIAHWDGSAWATPSGSSLSGDVLGVWGTPDNDVLAVGASTLGTFVAEFDGKSWASTRGSPGLGSGPTAMWGTSRSDVWVVSAYTILHFDGSVWETSAGAPSVALLRGVYASTPQDAWVVGDAPDGGGNGTLMHWDGSAWTALDSGVASALTSVWGTAPNDVWITTASTGILHYDGVVWTRVVVPVTGTLPATPDGTMWQRVMGTAANDVWFFGGYGWGGFNAGGFMRVAMHFDGTTWSTPAVIDGLPTSSNGDAPLPWFVGNSEIYGANPGSSPPLVRYDGAAWAVEHTGMNFNDPLASSDQGNPPGILGLWGTAADMWALGSNGLVLRKHR